MNEQRAAVKAEVIAILEDILQDWRSRYSGTGDAYTEVKGIGGERTLIEALERVRKEINTNGE